MNNPKQGSIGIVNASREDIKEIIRISFAVFEIERYFMLKLGEGFLLDVLGLIYETNKAHFFVAKDGEAVIGFIFGYPDTRAVSAALRKNAPRIGLKLLCGKYDTRLGLFEFIKDGLRTSMYMSRSQGGGELMSMAVLQDYQGRGIGSRLFERLEASFQGLTDRYLILTHSRLVKTVQFYLKMGCREHSRLRNGEIVIFEKTIGPAS